MTPKEAAIAQRCYCGKYQIGTWIGYGDSVGVAGTSTYSISVMDGRSIAQHAADICFAPRRLPKMRSSRVAPT